MTPEEEIDRLVRKDMPLTREITFTHRRMRAETAVKRNELREMYDRFEAEENALRFKRKKFRDEILRLWKEHFDGKKTLNLPSAKITLHNMMDIKIRDVAAVLDALDRADRLDLVTYTFNEKEVRKLIRENKLEGLPEDAVAIQYRDDLHVISKEKKHAKETRQE
jgi:hypothetical protein